MASRARHSTAQPTPSSSRPAPSQSASMRTSSSGPPSKYEHPNFPLNLEAQRKLANLKNTRGLTRLEDSLTNAIDKLTNAADDINQRLTQKRVKLDAALKREQENRDNGSNEADDEFIANQQKSFEDMRTKVNAMTVRMEETLRKVIDSKEYVAFSTESLDAAAQDARQHASTQASTQGSHSQRPRRAARGNDDGDEGSGDPEEELDDSEIPDFQPTDPAAGTQPGQASKDVFKEHLDGRRARYQSLTMSDRYGLNKEYVTYRKTIHEAMYPENEVDLQPAAHWFHDDGTVAPIGYTKPRSIDGEDSDDDIAVTRKNISTKCPVTLKEFEKPITSKKCNHSFETSAIMTLFDQTKQQTLPGPGQRGGQPAVRCPVSGCDQLLARKDLQSDSYIIRRIKTLQKRKRIELEEEEDNEEDDDDDDEGHRRSRNGPRSLDNDSDDDDKDDQTAVEKEAPMHLKTEARSTGASAAPAGTQAPCSTQTEVVDIPSEDDDEEDELYD